MSEVETVSTSAILKRINRRLARRGEVLRKIRGGENVYCELGVWCMFDIGSNWASYPRFHVEDDLRAFARELGVV